MIRLGVNIDHVATVRQARRAKEPDPVAAAVMALLGGADGITIHLREDRRHIQDRDLHLLRQTIPEGLNLELAAVEAMVDLACQVKPDQVTLVPERREELTTDGGLDVVANQQAVGRAAGRARRHGAGRARDETGHQSLSRWLHRRPHAPREAGLPHAPREAYDGRSRRKKCSPLAAAAAVCYISNLPRIRPACWSERCT